MANTALVTGASSGIGEELARVHAQAVELEGTGVTVTVLCTGPAAAELQQTSAMQHVKGFEFAPSGESVARRGYKAMSRGELAAFNDPKMGTMQWRESRRFGIIRRLTERWPSGRRRTPGKCVTGNRSRVRIPPSPPITPHLANSQESGARVQLPLAGERKTSRTATA